MKAAVIERPGELVVREVPMPEMGDYDALCQLLYGATCSGTDQHLLAGHFPWPVRYPTILGHESIGRVIRVGAKVRRFRAGDLVTRVGAPPSAGLNVNWGGFAECGLARDYWAMRDDGLPEAAWRPYRINQLLSPEADPRGATMVITWRETLSYVTRMGIGAGAHVLVMGSGGNGLSFAAHAANLGAAVTLVGSASREPLGRAVGATAYLDYRAADLRERLAQLPPADFVIDAVGKAGQIDLALPFLKSGGMVGIYGIDDYGRCQINPHAARVTFTVYNGGYEEGETHDAVVAYIQAKRLRAEIWLDLEHPFPLREIGQALEAVRQRRVVKALVQLAEG